MAFRILAVYWARRNAPTHKELAALDLFPAPLPSQMVGDFQTIASNAKTRTIPGWLCIGYVSSFLLAGALIVVLLLTVVLSD